MGRSTTFVDPPLNGQLTARQRLQERIALLDRSSLHSEWIVHVRACKIKDCSDSCTRQKKALAHVKKCRQPTCDHDSMCQITKEVLDHYKKCDKPKELCKICVHLLKIKPAAASAVEMATAELQQAVPPADPSVPEEPTISGEERAAEKEKGGAKKKKKKRNYAEVGATEIDPVTKANMNYIYAVCKSFPDDVPEWSDDWGLTTEFTHHEPVGWEIPASKGAICPPTPPESPVQWMDEVPPEYAMPELLECMFASTFKMARMASEPVDPAASLASAEHAAAVAATAALRDPPMPPETAAELFAQGWSSPALAESMVPLVTGATCEWQRAFLSSVFTKGPPATIKDLCGVLTPDQAATIASCSPEAAVITSMCTKLKSLEITGDEASSSTAFTSAVPKGKLGCDPSKYLTSWMPETERAKFRAMQAECALATPDTPNWIRKEDRDRLMAMNFDSPPPVDAEASSSSASAATVAAAAEAAAASAAPPTPSMSELYEAAARAHAKAREASSEKGASAAFSAAAAYAVSEQLKQSTSASSSAPSANPQTQPEPEQEKEKVCPKEFEGRVKRELDQLRIYASYLVHARDCDPESDCKFKFGMCGSMRSVIEHLKTCADRECTEFRCKEVRELVRHWYFCENREECMLCYHLTETGNPIDRYIKIDRLLIREMSKYSLAAQLMKIIGKQDEFLFPEDTEMTQSLASLSLEESTEGKGRE